MSAGLPAAASNYEFLMVSNPSTPASLELQLMQHLAHQIQSPPALCARASDASIVT